MSSLVPGPWSPTPSAVKPHWVLLAVLLWDNPEAGTPQAHRRSPGTEINNPGISQAMAMIPGGFFRLPFRTSSKEERQWVGPFRLDIDPVSVSRYQDFLASNPHWQKSQVKRIFADTSYLAAWSGLRPPAGSRNAPVTQVSWFAAAEYCAAAGKRLPSTAEWERTALQVPEGKDSAAYLSQALEGYSRPASQGGGMESISRNAFGIRGLFGNVWEWTSDFNIAGPIGGSEAKDRSFFCGGAAGAAAAGTDYATFMRYAFRSSLKPEFSLTSLGFRCAQDAP